MATSDGNVPLEQQLLQELQKNIDLVTKYQHKIDKIEVKKFQLDPEDEPLKCAQYNHKLSKYRAKKDGCETQANYIRYQIELLEKKSVTPDPKRQRQNHDGWSKEQRNELNKATEAMHAFEKLGDLGRRKFQNWFWTQADNVEAANKQNQDSPLASEEAETRLLRLLDRTHAHTPSDAKSQIDSAENRDHNTQTSEEENLGKNNENSNKRDTNDRSDSEVAPVDDEDEKLKHHIAKTILSHQIKNRLDKVSDISKIPVFTGITGVGDMAAIKWIKWMHDWITRSRKISGFDEETAIVNILRDRFAGQAKDKLTDTDYAEIKTYERLMQWVNKHFDMSETRAYLFNGVKKWSFPKLTAWNSICTLYMRDYEVMDTIREGVNKQKIIVTTMNETEKVDAIRAAIKLCAPDLHQKLMIRCTAHGIVPSTIKELDELILKLYKYEKEMRRNQLIAKDSAKIGAPTVHDVNAISGSEFGLNTTPNNTSSSKNFGTRNVGYGTKLGNVFGARRNQPFRVKSGVRVETQNVQNFGTRANQQTRNANNRFTKSFGGTSAQNMNWNDLKQIHTLGRSLTDSQRKNMVRRRGNYLNGMKIACIYGVAPDDSQLGTSGVPRMLLSGTCNKCGKRGHFGRFCILMNDHYPELIEIYEQSVKNQTSQVNLTTIKEKLTDAFRRKDTQGMATRSSEDAENRATSLMASLIKRDE